MLALDISKIIKIFTHHLSNQHNSWKVFCCIFSNQFTISENSDTVTDCIYLLQEMCNEDNSNSLSFQTIH